MGGYLIDTNVVISQIRGSEDVTNFFKQKAQEGLCLSSVSLAELYHGVYKSKSPVKNKRIVERWLEIPDLTILNIDRNVSLEYGKLMSLLEKRGMKLSQMDVLIAAVAKLNNITILTLDKKHFGRLGDFGVKVETV